ncbi:tail fiber domain-containing protein [Erwinia sp. SLM-02]|uniref:tail fiber domain-containing protein n=1 Tax=Erwinia sp. SLM-02 TaxID=3020057 RepID=UPI00307FD406
MTEQTKNAQILNGVNTDISELKSLSTLRTRVVSDGEIVSKSANGFRLSYGSNGVMLRNDGKTFYTLVTPAGQAQDGSWNALRPFSFNLTSGRVSMGNGLDISGGAMVSHNAGIGTATTSPATLIDGQTYSSAPVHSDLNSGGVLTSMLMETRVITKKDDYGLISYRDRKGSWNELQVRSNAELSVGQLVKRNANGWLWAAGTQNVNNNADRKTNGMHVQGAGNLFAEVYHYERIGKQHMLALHIANGGKEGWYEFRNDGNAYTNGTWSSSSDARMKTDVVKISDALDRLNKISGYTYLKQGVQEAGVIAQEVEAVLPQCVTQTELQLNDGSVLKDARSININGVVALLVEALKEERVARQELESRLLVIEAASVGN